MTELTNTPTPREPTTPDPGVPERATDDNRSDPGRTMLVLTGLLAMVGGAVAYVMESEDADGAFAEPANYALAQFLGVAGAYLVLLAAILSVARRR